MQYPPSTPAKEDSPQCSRSPSPSPCFTSTPRIRSESKKRQIEDGNDEQVCDVDAYLSDCELNIDTPVRQNKEKQKKFFISRDQTDRDTKIFENSRPDASVMFDELQNKDKSDTSPEGVKRETSFTPRTYKHSVKQSLSARHGVSPSLEGNPNAILRKPVSSTGFYGPTEPSRHLSPKKFCGSKSPYFQSSGKTYGISRFKLSHPSNPRSALSTLHNNNTSPPYKRSLSLTNRAKDPYHFNNENDSFYKSPEKAGDLSSLIQNEEYDDTKPKTVPSHEVGFENLGNTCYVNSTIQLLLGLVPFCSDVKAEPSLMSTHLPALQAIIKFSQSGKAVQAMGALKMLRQQFIKNIDDSFRGMKQQDASEFLCKYLDCIRDEINNTRRKYFPSLYEENSQNLIEENFEILVEEKNSCKDCEKAREEKQKHFQLFLSFPTEKVDKNDEDTFISFRDDLEKRMSIQSLVEQVLGSHTIKCIGCESENGLRVTKLTTLPRVILVQLKRYNNQSEKICNPAKISPYIELDKLVTDNCTSPKPIGIVKQNVAVQTMDKEESDSEENDFEKGLKLSLAAQQQETIDSDLQEAMRISLLEESNVENWSKDDVCRVWSRPHNVRHAYRLVGIILHEGFGIKQGHYTANVYRHDIKKWMFYSDSVAREVDANELFGTRNQRNCYLLAYMHQDIFEAAEKNSETITI